MKTLDSLVTSKKSLQGEMEVPSDKSIAQRSIMLAAVATGESLIEKFPFAGDPQSTLGAVEKLGVKVVKNIANGQSELIVSGTGFEGLKEPEEILDFQNSGTGMRLMMGLLSGNPSGLFAVLTGDQSLRKRPMKRVVTPLKELGAEIWGRGNGEYAPLCLKGKSLAGGQITTKVASAQLKSALLLSGLNAQGSLTVIEPELSRDHTEIMLKSFGATVSKQSALSTTISPSSLIGSHIIIPGDFSSACFFIVAACIVPDSKIKIKNIGLNPTRTAALNVLQKMGANIQIHLNPNSSSGEVTGDLEVSYSQLVGCEIGGEIIPNLIDEIPILCLAAAQARGQTVIKDAQELRVKESDRLKAMYALLKGLGVEVEENPDGLTIQGLEGKTFSPNAEVFEAGHDHRIAMTAGIAALLSDKEMCLNGSEWANISFPGFFELLAKLSNHQ